MACICLSALMLTRVTARPSRGTLAKEHYRNGTLN